MANYYSPKELLAMYNRIKITHNPSGYSFKDRLIEYSKSLDITKEVMSYVSFDTEQELLSKIKTFWKVSETSPPPSYGRLGKSTPSSTFEKDWTDIRSVSFLVHPTLHSATFVSTDHLLFSIYNIVKNMPSGDVKDIKKSNILEGLVTACYLLTTPKSISADLKWVCTNMHTRFDYENLHSLQFLKDVLTDETWSKLYSIYSPSTFENINCPAPVTEYSACPCANFANSSGFYEPDLMDISFNEEVYKETLKLMYIETVAFGLEFAYVINRYTSSYTNRMLYEICTGTMKSTSNKLTELIYKKDKVEFQPAIDLPDVPKERFKAILEYVQSDDVNSKIDLICGSFMKRLGYYNIPSMLSAVLSFAKNHSYRNIRVKQCAILYNYCKTNGLIESGSADDMLSEGSSAEGFAKSVMEAAGMFTEEDSEHKRMLDLREGRKAGAKCAPGGGHDSTSVSQALDGMVDNFRTEKYGFTVKNIYSDDDALKTKYEAIASKIKLINSQLIKQIRDIKTYNTGGKYAGLPSGKLDRKNLHKYKTDKNIFYQNTYKQKECDLAFGIVLDASGSMYGRGIEDGKVTMIVLHETLKALGINHSIIDHTCYGKRYTSDLRRYQCFKEDKGYRLRKNYALAGITAESGNCDSGALWFMEKALLRTRNRDKICLIFSDGAPTECSGADLVAQVKHMEHVGIKVIGIGIGFPNISKYYTDYANGNNLKEMLDIVAGILKEYVISKKD